MRAIIAGVKALAVILFALLVFVLPLAAQDGKSKTYTVRTNLMVLNDKNEFVTKLKSSDVRVFESGIEQKITSFVELETAADISIVIDNSGSVRTQLDDIVNIGRLIVANLMPDDNAQIIRFVGRDKIEIEEPWTNKQAGLFEALDNLFVEGGQSAVIDALYLASEDLIKRNEKSGARRQAIVLISDAEDRNSYYTEKELFKLLENTPVQIFTITLTKDLPKGFWDMEPGRKSVGTVIKLVNKLAANTGGTSFIFKKKSTKDDLVKALTALMIELRSQYVVSYTSENVNKDNNVRKLTATVADGPNGEKRSAYIKDTIVLVPPK